MYTYDYEYMFSRIVFGVLVMNFVIVPVCYKIQNIIKIGLYFTEIIALYDDDFKMAVVRQLEYFLSLTNFMAFDGDYCRISRKRTKFSEN